MTHILNSAGWTFLCFLIVLAMLPPHGEAWKKLPKEKRERIVNAQAMIAAFVAGSIFFILL